MDANEMFTIDKNELDRLIGVLRAEGYHVVGPTIRDGAIVYDQITSNQDLPKGWTEEQDAGTYRLRRRGDDAWFGYVVGPHSWKKYLFPPRLRLFSIKRNGQRVPEIEDNDPVVPRYVFLGVRSCELAAIRIQDRVFNSDMADPYYARVRREALIIAVNCTQPGGTCFCSSMNTGPRCTGGYDLALTELSTSFAVQVGSERGRVLLDRVNYHVADANTRHLVDLVMQTAAGRMGRALDTNGLPEILLNNLEHPHWDKVAERCLACANCTLACPTCFCSNVEDTTDLTGDHAERWRTWGSCFTLEFSYHTGGWNRSSLRSRYRQWMTHKLAGWHEQFGTSGCVGCGRCITWCPVGIDITAEAKAITEDVRQSQQRRSSAAQLESGGTQGAPS